jgi:hypothetical protein
LVHAFLTKVTKELFQNGFVKLNWSESRKIINKNKSKEDINYHVSKKWYDIMRETEIKVVIPNCQVFLVLVSITVSIPRPWGACFYLCQIRTNWGVCVCANW